MKTQGKEKRRLESKQERRRTGYAFKQLALRMFSHRGPGSTVRSEQFLRDGHSLICLGGNGGE